MFIPVILTKSERRRSEGAWKYPEDFSLSIRHQGILTIPRQLLGMIHHHGFLILSLFLVPPTPKCAASRSDTSVRAWVYSCR